MEIFCQLCDHVTSKIKSLRSHYKSEHPGEHCFVDNIQCDQCDRKFANSASYLCQVRDRSRVNDERSDPGPGGHVAVNWQAFSIMYLLEG